METIQFRDRALNHLSWYKTNVLGCTLDGEFKNSTKAYNHILPRGEEGIKLNLLPGISFPIPFKPHIFAHHLNSSQMLCYNFFEAVRKNAEDQKILLAVLRGLSGFNFSDGAAIESTEFEYVNNSEERTNFDFYIKLTTGERIFLEVKYTESEFGGLSSNKKNPGKYHKKWDKTYKKHLNESMYFKESLKCEDAQNCFYKHYQINRNLSYIQSEKDYCILIFPFDNDNLYKEATRVLGSKDDLFFKNAAYLNWNDLVAAMMSACENTSLYQHFTRFAEKYFPVERKASFDNDQLKINDIVETVQIASDLLSMNPEWVDRYDGYADQIAANMDKIKSARQSFHEWAPLKLYLNVTNVKKAHSNFRFDIRYLGQSVAELLSNGSLLLDTSNRNATNLRDFGCTIQLLKAAWVGPDAKNFRSYFKKHFEGKTSYKNLGNEEHRLESLLLSEFSKNSGKTKILQNIQPVKIADVRFPMPTPLRASNHNQIKYSNYFGGGIDILTRVGTGGKNTHLCIMELKDQNLSSEPPKAALMQAVTYAVFIRELLRSKSGNKWWKLFGFGGVVPPKLTLYAACVMPDNGCIDKSFEGEEILLKGDVIKLHYLYFGECENQISIIQTSLKSQKS